MLTTAVLDEDLLRGKPLALGGELPLIRFGGCGL